MYRHALTAAFFAKRAAEVGHREYFIYKGFGTLAEAPREVLQSPYYVGVLSESFFGAISLFLLSTFESQEAMKKKASRLLCNSIISASDESHHERERKDRRSRYMSMRKTLKKHLGDGGDRM